MNAQKFGGRAWAGNAIARRFESSYYISFFLFSLLALSDYSFCRLTASSANGRVITSGTHRKLVGLTASIGLDGEVQISGDAWNSPEA